MTKQIEDYTADELSAKIKAIKAERERTANALKRYEEELERRKNKNWLPLNEEINFTANQLALDTSCIEIKVREGFHDKDSFHKYLSALKTIRKAWFANSKGEPIDIEWFYFSTTFVCADMKTPSNPPVIWVQYRFF